MKKIFQYIALVTLITFVACGKSKFLDQVSSSSFYVPKTIEDFEKLLENENLFSQTHSLVVISADQFYFTDPFLKDMDNAERRAYTWDPIIFQSEEVTDDWIVPYTQITTANEVLTGLDKTPKNQSNLKKIAYLEGAARFLRAYGFHNLSQCFVPLYDSAIADLKWGIPLRKTSDINEVSTRSTIQQTYDEIINDLVHAAQLLPEKIDFLHPNRPSRPAAFAALARVHLSMRQYSKAGAYADSCLQLYNTLIDFNSIDPSNNTPFTPTNEETLYQSRLFSSSSLISGIVSGGCFIDSLLYRSYAPNDLRRSIFFSVWPDGKVSPKGSFYGNIVCFMGLGVSEIFLIRAECYARAGLTAPALADLNTLLQERWRNDYFVPVSANNSADALKIILTERNKELVLRGQRWSDIRRLNREHPTIYLSRFVNGQQYVLQPNDSSYVLPIPQKVIKLTGMAQNPR